MRTVLLTLAIATMAIPALTNNGGAPAGKSGSPKSNNATCNTSYCHSGPAVSTQSISVTTDIPTDGYVDNGSYSITVTMTDGGTSAPKMGFTASVEDASNHQGILSAGTGSQIQGNNYVTHTSSSTSSSSGSNSWTFGWNAGTAPDNTLIYVAGNFANNDGSNGGDGIASMSMGLTRSHVSLDEPLGMTMTIMPNPSSQWLKIDATFATSKGTLNITDLQGRLIRSQSWTAADAAGKLIDVRDLANGTYLLRLSMQDGQSIGQPFIVRH